MAYEGQSDAFDEVVRVIGRELQASRGRIKELEEALTKSQDRCSSSSTSPEVENQLLERAINAEGREAKLRLEVDDSQRELVRQGKKIKNLQKQLETLRAVKQEVELAVAQEHEARTQLGEQRKELANKNLETSSLLKQLDETRKDLAMQRMQTSSLQKQLDEMRRERDEFKEVALLKENASALQLEAELANKAAENGVLAGRVSELQEAVSKLNKQTKTCEEYPWSVERYIALSKRGNYLDVPNRPNYRSLRPVCVPDVNLLKHHIEIDDRTKWVSGNYICVPTPERLIWTTESCQVGLVFSPTHVYRGPWGGFEPYSEFQKQQGRSVEVFFSDPGHIYYAGTYVVKGTREEAPQGCLRGNWDTARPLAEISASFDDDYEESSYASVPLLGSLFVGGILRADCTILRCVGFNHEIHNTLSARFEVVKPVQDRLHAIPWAKRVDREGYRDAIQEFYAELEARREVEGSQIGDKSDNIRRGRITNNWPMFSSGWTR